jgi:small conductance mechanosensitive channel
MEHWKNAVDIGRLTTQFLDFLPNLFVAIVILFAFWSAFRLTRGPVSKVLLRAGFDEALVRLLVENFYRGILVIFGLVMAADQVGVNVGAALAGIGVAGLAVGIAAQDSLSNIFAGIMIFWDKPFSVGDWVRVAGQYGRVSEITVRSTRIRTNNNTYVVIPNKKIVDEVLVNQSMYGETRVDVPVGIAYKESVPEAREVLLAAVRGLEGVADQPEPEVVVTELGGSSVNLDMRIWIADAAVEQPVFARVIEACKLALDAAGIQIPYPHLQLFVDNVEDRVWGKAAAVLAGGVRGQGGGPAHPDSGNSTSM